MNCFKILLFCFAVSRAWASDMEEDSGSGDCPMVPEHYHLKYWDNLMNKPENRRRGFIAQDIYFSKFIVKNATIGAYEKRSNLEKVYSYSSSMGLYRSQIDPVIAFRRQSNRVLMSFIQGDSALVHQIDPATGKYTATELGFETKNFFIAIEPGMWHTIEMKRQDGGFVVMGAVIVRRNDGNDYYDMMSTEDAAKFPQHNEIIKRQQSI